MAFMNQEKKQPIVANLKKAFPAKDGWKFSISVSDHVSLNVVILSAPLHLEDMYDEDGESINQYHFRSHAEQAICIPINQNEMLDVIDKIISICNEGNHDRSDIQSDYFDVGWYFNLRIGKWNKPFIYTGS
jgi:hypothetical protein